MTASSNTRTSSNTLEIATKHLIAYSPTTAPPLLTCSPNYHFPIFRNQLYLITVAKHSVLIQPVPGFATANTDTATTGFLSTNVALRSMSMFNEAKSR